MKKIILLAMLLLCYSNNTIAEPEVELIANYPTPLYYNDTVRLTARIRNTSEFDVCWEVNRGFGWEHLGVWGSHYSFVVKENEEHYKYRFTVFYYPETAFKQNSILDVESEFFADVYFEDFVYEY